MITMAQFQSFVFLFLVGCIPSHAFVAHRPSLLRRSSFSSSPSYGNEEGGVTTDGIFAPRPNIKDSIQQDDEIQQSDEVEGTLKDVDIESLLAKLKDSGAGGAGGYEPPITTPDSGRGVGYTWTGDDSTMYVRVPIPLDTKAKALEISISPTTLRVGVSGQPGFWADGKLDGKVRSDSSFWTVEEAMDEEKGGVGEGEEEDFKVIVIHLEKAPGGLPNHWTELLVGETKSLAEEAQKIVGRVFDDLPPPQDSD